MIVDTSALIAILRNEPDADRYVDALARSQTAISAGTYLEASIVVDANGDPVLSRRFDDLIDVAEVVVEPFTSEQCAIARACYNDFGKGSGHPAKLNFGDCFAYALARTRGEPLLYKGGDFGHTDIAGALVEN